MKITREYITTKLDEAKASSLEFVKSEIAKEVITEGILTEAVYFIFNKKNEEVVDGPFNSKSQASLKLSEDKNLVIMTDKQIEKKFGVSEEEAVDESTKTPSTNKNDAENKGKVKGMDSADLSLAKEVASLLSDNLVSKGLLSWAQQKALELTTKYGPEWQKDVVSQMENRGLKVVSEEAEDLNESTFGEIVTKAKSYAETGNLTKLQDCMEKAKKDLFGMNMGDWAKNKDNIQAYNKIVDMYKSELGWGDPDQTVGLKKKD